MFLADIKAKESAIVVAQVNLGYARITAPVAGSVGERHVQVGQLVAPGMPVIDLVQGDVWIQANYKETQLTNMRVGDVADVRVDTFPGVVLHGKVLEIAPASGSQFALLPPDNATGKLHQDRAENPGQDRARYPAILCKASYGPAFPW